MFNKEGRPIKEEWEAYYKTLENIRRSGICNMWGASPYLKALHPKLSRQESNEILSNWIANYDELCKKYNWRS
jgi:hypothetical protein